MLLVLSSSSEEARPLYGGRLCGWWAALQVGTWARRKPKSSDSQAGYWCVLWVSMGTEDKGVERSQSHGGRTRHLLNSDGGR